MRRVLFRFLAQSIFALLCFALLFFALHARLGPARLALLHRSLAPFSGRCAPAQQRLPECLSRRSVVARRSVILSCPGAEAGCLLSVVGLDERKTTQPAEYNMPHSATQQVLKPLSVSTKIHMLPTSVMLENIIQNIQSTPLYIDSVRLL